MNEKPTLKKSRNFYVPPKDEDYPQDGNSFDESIINHLDMDEEDVNDTIAVEQMVSEIVSRQVKEYCTEHFEEIIAAAIMLHDAKQKRKLVKAAKQNKCL